MAAVKADCLFCKIGRREIEPVVLAETERLLVFLDRNPIREGHALIIPKAHYDYFDDAPLAVVNEITALAQRLAKRLKEIYPVEKAAYMFSGGDIAHVHAHVLPLHKNSDLTSLRYVTAPAQGEIVLGMAHLTQEAEALAAVREKIGPLT
ncbi:HIT family protein [Limibacillus halophilus]|uniref:Histidine triad (HIT) family protein n=1 Tax=Limibacillus halophilus TaxID=1579333 RepID=A0A839SZG0_9PROT|nr:HIT family protein [Limibacillus halophilus]MBB3066425.1 histidine triad (HIT) family protein [Limibacillus halophilus]